MDEYEHRFKDGGVKIVCLPYTTRTSSTLLRSVLQRLSAQSRDARR
jgi:hypothetical protein